MLERFRKIKDKEMTEDSLVDIHHEMMSYYHCWIPVDELRRTPIPTILGLIDRINKDMKKPRPIPVVIMGYAKKSKRLD